MTTRYRLFIYLSGFILLANLLVMNDFTALWPGAESLLAWRGLGGVQGGSPLELLLPVIMGEGEIPHFWMRLPGVLLFVLALLAFWGITRKLFGRDVLLLALLVLSASLLVPNLAKVATGDIWAMGSQWLAFATLIRFLKQPVLMWRLAFYTLLLLAVWIQPANALIFLLGSSAFLYFLHPQGKRLWSLNPWGVGLLIALALHFAGLLSFSEDTSLVGFRTGRFLLWNLFGILPFLGFVLAGAWEAIRRVGRREEMALLNVGGLLFALLGHSLALQGIFALLAARQLRNYSDPNYPHGPIVKTGALLHLVLAFCVLTPLMIGGFFQFRAVGFRAMLATGGVYWMLSFIAVIGLFGPNRRYLLGGTILGGLLLTAFFWLQANPLLQQKLGWHRTLVERSLVETKNMGAVTAYLIQGEEEPFSPLAPYCRAAYPETRMVKEGNLREAWEAANSAVFLLEISQAEGLAGAARADTIRGWDSRLKNVEYILLVKQ